MCLEPYLSRFKRGEIKPLSLEKGPVGGGYSIYGYRAFYLKFDDGSVLSTSNWMYPDSKKTERKLRDAFGL